MFTKFFPRVIGALSALKGPLLLMTSAALGAGLAIYVAPKLGPSPAPDGPGSFDARFVPVGKAYVSELAKVYADAWAQGATLLETGQPVATAIGTVSKVWNDGRANLFDRVVTPEFAKLVTEGKDQAEINDASRLALARAWRGFARGLSGNGK